MASGDDGFEARLQAARARQGLEQPDVPRRQQLPEGLGSALRVGVELVSALMVGLGIGWFLDRRLHTKPLFLVVFVLMGAVAGVLNVWRVVGRSTAPPR